MLHHRIMDSFSKSFKIIEDRSRDSVACERRRISGGGENLDSRKYVCVRRLETVKLETENNLVRRASALQK